jgi:integrative and conjugative element protein (TIGR02256 family)
VPDLRHAASVIAEHIVISRWALRDICELAQATRDGRETGGILLGFDARRHEPLTVTMAGDAGPGAQRSATGFRRDLGHAQQLAHRAWVTQGAVWVGDWHTHPAGPPAPSRVDLGGYRSVLSHGEMPGFVSLILAPHPQQGWDDPALGCWWITAIQVQALALWVACASRTSGAPVS